MAEPRDIEIARARARAEQERRRRLSQAREEEMEEPTSFMDKAGAAYDYAGRLAGEVNAGIFSLLPQQAQQKLQELNIMRSPEQRLEGPIGRGAEFVGMAAPAAVGLPAAGARLPATLSRPGVFRTMIDDITRFAQNNPRLYFTAEGAGAFGAGAAGGLAEEEGAGPGAVMLADLIGGTTAGGLASVGPRSLRALREGLRANLAPMTEEGGMTRAARQMQARAGGPENASTMASQLDDIPEGFTPAQWIGDERLMSQEARLLQDNPELQNQVRQELNEVRMASQEALRDSFGQPRSRQDWERSVLERVTPEGAVIEPGMSDEMLDQAYRSFRPLYETAEGYNLPSAGLNRGITESVLDESIIATDAERESVQKWLNNQYSAFEKQISDGEIPSESLLEFRSKIRDQRRMQSKRGNEERADLLGAAEAEITKRLEQGLPEEVTETVRAADSQYRKYKVVENALFNAGDANLSPEQLSQSIRQGGLTSSSRYARGTDEVTQELRRLALAGRSTEEVLGDPRRASLFVRDLGEAERQAIQADFANTLYNRAKERAVEATEGGAPFISGKKLMQDINENREVMKNLGMSTEDIGRFENIARQIQAAERKSPRAVEQLFEDGPATVMQLGAALLGAKSGQRLAGQGLGSSLVLAQFMSNKARNTLANMTSDQAEKLMEDAVTDPKLYKALLTKSLVQRDAKENAAYLESWLLASALDQMRNQESE